MNDLIDRQAAIDAANDWLLDCLNVKKQDRSCGLIRRLEDLPSAQPEYEELTSEEAASEIASGSTMSAWYWLDDMTRLKQMGYAICRKKG